MGVKESSKCGEGDGIKPMLSPFAFTFKYEVQGQFWGLKCLICKSLCVKVVLASVIVKCLKTVNLSDFLYTLSAAEIFL